MIEVFQHVVPRDQLVDPFARRFDDSEQPHRFVVGHLAIHDGLLGQSKPEIAPGSRHDTESPHHVVVDFTAAAVHIIVNRGEVVFHVDPLAYDLRTGQQHFEQTIAGILPIVVGMKKDTSS